MYTETYKTEEKKESNGKVPIVDRFTENLKKKSFNMVYLLKIPDVELFDKSIFTKK